MSSKENAASASYDRIARARTGDMTSKDTPFRHFNNYVKKVLVQFSLDAARTHCNCTAADGSRRVAVLDLASGRGGDLGKWLYMQSPPATTPAPSPRFQRQSPVPRWGRGSESNSPKSDSGFFSRAESVIAKTGDFPDTSVKMTHYEGYDISAECIAEAQRRFATLSKDSSCRAKFEVADCFSDSFLHNLKEHYQEQFQIVSIQFALHYACGSTEKVKELIEAISACLAPGGIVVVTTVDPFELSDRVRNKRLSNNLFSIVLPSAEPEWEERDAVATSGADAKLLLKTGTEYHFKLKGFVDCVEYVVPIDFVRSCMTECGMEEAPEVSKPFSKFLCEYGRDWGKNRGNILSAAEEELTTLYTTLVFCKHAQARP